MKRLAKKKTIKRDFSQFLEFLGLIVEVGTDLLSAISIVSSIFQAGKVRETAEQYLELLKLGKSRQEALSVWTKNIPLPCTREFVQNLEHSWQTGGSVGRLLKLQAAQMRREELEEAERMALKMPFLALIPLLFFIFPSALIIICAPLLLLVQQWGL